MMIIVSSSIHNMTIDTITDAHKVDIIFLISVTLIFGCIGNAFIIINTLRYTTRRNTFNCTLLWGRFINLLLGCALPIILLEGHAKCMCIYILIPFIILHEKINLTLCALIKVGYLSVKRKCGAFPIVLNVFLNLSLSYLPYTSYFFESFVSYQFCTRGILSSLKTELPSSYMFLYMYDIIGLNSIVVDIICYCHLFRHAHNKNTIIRPFDPSKSSSRPFSLSVHLINYYSCFVVLVISIFVMIPPSALLNKPLIRIHEDSILSLLFYQIPAMMLIISFTPYLVIGSSQSLINDTKQLKGSCKRGEDVNG
nr:uncharacterized protein LOC121121695 [Lepeophtheirus salmonis]